MLNRGSVIVRPKQPYIDWASQLDDSGLVPSVEGEQTVYLVPEYDNDEHALQIIAQCFDIIFEAELSGWHLDESAWPKKRTFSMFLDWFSLEFHSVIEDLCEYEILDDEDLD